MYPIVQAPSEILRSPAQPVNFSGPKLATIINEMTQTLLAQKDPEGVGLAANQVNLPWKIFITRFDPKHKGPIQVFINPEIVEHSDELQPTDEDKKPQLEGCLSKPNYYGIVKRWRSVTVKYQTVENNDFENYPPAGGLKIENFSGFPATVIQHEMDHLNGKIFIERIIEQQGKLYKIVGKNNKGKEEWEEVEF